MDKVKVVIFVVSDKETALINKDLKQINKNLIIKTLENLRNIAEFIKQETPQIIIVDTDIMEKQGKELLLSKTNIQYKLILHSLGNYFEVKGNKNSDAGYILNLIEEDQLKDIFTIYL